MLLPVTIAEARTPVLNALSRHLAASEALVSLQG